MLDPDDRCPVCATAGGRCLGPGVAHVDMASRIQEFAVARGQQQTRRAPGRPLADPAAEAARQEAWLAKQDTTTPPEARGEPPAPPVETPIPDPVGTDATPAEVTPVSEPAPEPVLADTQVVEPTALGAPAEPGTAMTLAPVNPELGRTIDPNAGSPRYTNEPTLVRGDGPGVYKTQGADARIARTPVPATDPTEVRDVYIVPEGVISPEDDPARPSPADTVIVGDAAELVATGAWASLPGGTSIVTTRKVLRVWWPMGTLSPCYSTVADRGVVLPRPAAAR